jgi:hypothetical protein
MDAAFTLYPHRGVFVTAIPWQGVYAIPAAVALPFAVFGAYPVHDAHRTGNEQTEQTTEQVLFGLKPLPHLAFSHSEQDEQTYSLTGDIFRKENPQKLARARARKEFSVLPVRSVRNGLTL